MSANRLTLDSNILAYAVDTRDPVKQRMAIEIVTAAARISCPLALQAIGEFYVAATRKVKLRPLDVQPRVAEFLQTFETFSYSRSAVAIASREAAIGRFQFWDAVLLASSAEFGCTIFLSEDMHEGAKLGELVIVNPFGASGLTARARDVLELTA